ncbi:tol-pal system-associated acyl-CoA thioesterase [Luteimonas deserti]|uniref:Tol-pal system-associated acyl-CoA thioesterase n=1 Tax=Luteimonas deserti TaxID=2752306 RepID=A0A7Z0QR14_9GAMM|nr:tol-pal system-associated acyl-CoA thioesterase [Luteimonas deserti]NYZ62386.1 tol-pal system-associated acyl-CoA thioesterase [Luteimonas deserti]
MAHPPMSAPGVTRLFSWPTRVYWEDTDAGGVVYHAQYVAFMERARSEWLRALGHGQAELRDVHGTVFAVRAVRVDFRAPARLDDALQVSVVLRTCRRASAVFAQQIHRGNDLLVDADVRVAALSAADFRPQAIPDALYAQLKSLETSAE